MKFTYKDTVVHEAYYYLKDSQDSIKNGTPTLLSNNVKAHGDIIICHCDENNRRLYSMMNINDLEKMIHQAGGYNTITEIKDEDVKKFEFRTTNIPPTEYKYSFLKLNHTGGRASLEHLNFFEVITEGPQKPRFDIETEDSWVTDEWFDYFIDYMCSLIIECCKLWGVEIDPVKNIIVYESTGMIEKGKKYSVHIIVDGVYHPDHEEAKVFYDHVVSHLPDNVKKFVDPSVYSSLQQFRLPYNRKAGTNRMKFDKYWTYNGKKIVYNDSEDINNIKLSHLNRFRYSLVGLILNTSKLLVCPITIDKMKKTKFIGGEVSESEIEGAINMFHRIAPYHEDSFNVEESLGTTIKLKRKKSCYCLVCNRTHDNENAYLTISGDKKNVHLRCFRNHGQSFMLGSLDLGTLASVEVSAKRWEVKKEPRMQQIMDYQKLCICTSTKFILPILDERLLIKK